MTITYISRRIVRSLTYRVKKYRTSLRSGVKTARSQFRQKTRPQFFVFILGCQRSGTTLLERIFRHDFNSAVFGEFCELAIDSQRTVWKPLGEVKQILDVQNFDYAVARPLFESDRAAEIIAFFQPSAAVWVFRDFRYVVNSMINKWGAEFFNISRRVEANENDIWRLETLYQDIKKEAMDLTGADNRIEDLYALYWLKRNQIVFDESLKTNRRVLVLDYVKLVSEPKQCVDKIIRTAGGSGVWDGFVTDADRKNATKKIAIELSANIETKCDQMIARLNEIGQRDFGAVC